ncbi:hypothetical protein Tsubulata_016739 [Turnera subulata]|uniref:Receptor-like serine/threonine-protein kinase n=1 Tax=Turnera subulata TaxID=218843 RepID=A0A9Q0G9T6_9ROSI|nr:hypothetical protein Tsubulata_016739 [Turnera subulata]
MLTISYSGGVPIWSAGGATVDPGGAFHFLEDGLLRLVNGSGTTVWDSNTASLGVNSAILEDSGNLVLQKNNSAVVWSSFQNPTDTLVPYQNFSTGQVLRSGLYSFGLLYPGKLALTWNDSVVFWNLGPDHNMTSPSLQLQESGVLSVSDTNLTNGVPDQIVYSADYGEGNDVLRFLKLDADGNLRIYSSSRGSGTVTVEWTALTDQCQVFGYCGNMGICRYNNSNPICTCPSDNFEPFDLTDSRSGCKRKVELGDCKEGGVTMLELQNTKFFTYQSQQIFIVAKTACKSNCLTSSPCVASTALADGSGSCYMKPSEFVSGMESEVIPSISYVKVCGPVAPTPSSPTQILKQPKWWKGKVQIVVVSVAASLLGLLALEGGLWWWCCKRNRRFPGVWPEYGSLGYASGAPVRFSYKQLHKSTKGFKEKLGEGGFGAVYKGVIDGKTNVAVKKLEGIEQGEKHFRMEVAAISSIHHLNLVRLIGFCSEGRHRLLVYEHMKHGSLDSFLFTTEQMGKQLNWKSRFNIALGTAKGIAYLHEECRDCIVHCDLKPENILLDENKTPKVSDFGLAKLINSKDHRIQTLKTVRGTRGYLAPEWLANLPITSKSDVYSYGKVLLEIVSGRRNFEVSGESNRAKKFWEWAYEEFDRGNLEAIVDSRISCQDPDMEQVMRAVQVSFWCIQEQPSCRPRMGKVVQMLEGIIEIQRPPPPKAASEVSINEVAITVNNNSITSSSNGEYRM